MTGGAPGPLAWRRVLITRAAGEGRSLADAIRRLGGEPWEVPVIAIAGPPDPAQVAAAAARVPEYGWVVFTSRHGVERLVAALEAAGVGAQALRGCRLVAVGPATARALEGEGLAAVRVPESPDAAGVLRLLLQEVRPGDRVLVVRPLEAAMDLATPLRAAGAEVDEVVAYRTVPALPAGALAPALRERPVHYVTFTSGSTVRALLDAAGGPEALQGVRVACIGPRTAEAARRLGLTVHVVGPGNSVEALAEAIGADAARHAG